MGVCVYSYILFLKTTLKNGFMVLLFPIIVYLYTVNDSPYILIH